MEFVFSLPKTFLAALFFILGSLFGSFANVLIYRMQRPKPLELFNRSRCPKCSFVIPFYLNIPLISWFLLKGRCRKCGSPFSFRYPVVEFLSAFVFALLFFYIGWKWFLLEALVFSFGLIVVSFIDWDQMILPDSFTISGTALGLVGGYFNPERSFGEAFFGALFGGFAFWLIAKLYFLVRGSEGMGGGDIKLSAWIGSVLGWKALPFVVLSASLSGLLVGSFLIVRKKQKFDTPLPFGPFLAASAFVCVFLSMEPVFYLDFLFPFGFF